jgi:hypothetical protein
MIYISSELIELSSQIKLGYEEKTKEITTVSVVLYAIKNNVRLHKL